MERDSAQGSCGPLPAGRRGAAAAKAAHRAARPRAPSRRRRLQGSWAIGLFRGPSPLNLTPAERWAPRLDGPAAWPAANPVLSCAEVASPASNFGGRWALGAGCWVLGAGCSEYPAGSGCAGRGKQCCCWRPIPAASAGTASKGWASLPANAVTNMPTLVLHSGAVADPFLYIPSANSSSSAWYLFFETKSNPDMQGGRGWARVWACGHVVGHGRWPCCAHLRLRGFNALGTSADRQYCARPVACRPPLAAPPAGDIGVAESRDGGASWRYLGLALDEHWHLSYPFVFEWRGEVGGPGGTRGPRAQCMARMCGASRMDGRHSQEPLFDRWSANTVLCRSTCFLKATAPARCGCTGAGHS